MTDTDESNCHHPPHQEQIVSRKQFQWKRELLGDVQKTPDVFNTTDGLQSPLPYFRKCFDAELINTIVSDTNLYSVRQQGVSIDTNYEEMEQFLGILLLMGVVSMPAFSDYWSEDYRYSPIADIMPIHRFKKLRRLIHFVSEENKSNKYAKIRPVLERIRRNCSGIDQEHQQSIDEMMVPYKGTRAGKLHQYIRNKPHKWGFKLFVRAGVSGMVYDMLPYAGSDTFFDHTFTEEEETLGLGAKVVIAFCKTLQEPQQTVIYFDNFSSLELLKYLKKVKGIHALGTIRP